MQIDWDVRIEMEDGAVLRADVFRPAEPGRYPVLLSHGVYGKGLPVERFRHRLHTLAESLPENVLVPDVADVVNEGSNAVADDDYRVWEVVDPAEWVPHGYVCVRVDSRGSGASPGRLDPLSPREMRDYAACVEWAGTQAWSNGRVGLCGKSYYAMSQWLVAALQPPHLAALCVWHGWSDWYRDATRHGGILYQFWEKFWYPQLALPVQYGREAGTNPHSGRAITGEQTFDAATLADNRADLVNDLRTHAFEDEYYRERTPRLDQVNVPVLATDDWSDQDLHLRGTIHGFLNAASPNKWLEIHAGGQFDDTAAVELQRRFLDFHLKGTESGWREQPRVQLAIRHVADGTVVRKIPEILNASEWPIPGTEWRSWYLDFRQNLLTAEPSGIVSQSAYTAEGPGMTLHTAPSSEAVTIAGPLSATLWISSSTADADLFLVLDAVDGSGNAVELRDHRGGITPVSVGWLRASHRAIDPERSTPWQPFHTHHASEPLRAGQVYEMRIEMRPTGLYLPAGYRLRLSIRGHGRLHNDPLDRPEELFSNEVTLHSGPAMLAHLLIPIIPASRAGETPA